jgi:hypothetical protein
MTATIMITVINYNKNTPVHFLCQVGQASNCDERARNIYVIGNAGLTACDLAERPSHESYRTLIAKSLQTPYRLRLL